MKYSSLFNNNKIQQHKTSKQEIDALLRIAERDIADAKIKGISDDRSFATAYNAALQLSTIILAIEGFRTRGQAHHKTTFDFLELSDFKNLYPYAMYFNKCRQKRNDVDYDRTFVVSEKEKNELIQKAEEFYGLVKKLLP